MKLNEQTKPKDVVPFSSLWTIEMESISLYNYPALKRPGER